MTRHHGLALLTMLAMGGCVADSAVESRAPRIGEDGYGMSPDRPVVLVASDPGSFEALGPFEVDLDDAVLAGAPWVPLDDPGYEGAAPDDPGFVLQVGEVMPTASDVPPAASGILPILIGGGVIAIELAETPQGQQALNWGIGLALSAMIVIKTEAWRVIPPILRWARATAMSIAVTVYDAAARPHAVPQEWIERIQRDTDPSCNQFGSGSGAPGLIAPATYANHVFAWTGGASGAATPLCLAPRIFALFGRSKPMVVGIDNESGRVLQASVVGVPAERAFGTFPPALGTWSEPLSLLPPYPPFFFMTVLDAGAPHLVYFLNASTP
jgi:hypothetical protein